MSETLKIALIKIDSQDDFIYTKNYSISLIHELNVSNASTLIKEVRILPTALVSANEDAPRLLMRCITTK